MQFQVPISGPAFTRLVTYMDRQQSQSKMRLIVVMVHDCWFLDRCFSFTLLLLRISRGFEMEGFHTVYVERQPEVLVRSIRSLQCSIGIFYHYGASLGTAENGCSIQSSLIVSGKKNKKTPEWFTEGACSPPSLLRDTMIKLVQ